MPTPSLVRGLSQAAAVVTLRKEQHSNRDAEMPARRFLWGVFLSLLPLPTVTLSPRPDGGVKRRGERVLELPELSEQETEMSLWEGNAVSLRCNRLSR